MCAVRSFDCDLLYLNDMYKTNEKFYFIGKQTRKIKWGKVFKPKTLCGMQTFELKGRTKLSLFFFSTLLCYLILTCLVFQQGQVILTKGKICCVGIFNTQKPKHKMVNSIWNILLQWPAFSDDRNGMLHQLQFN